MSIPQALMADPMTTERLTPQTSILRPKNMRVSRADMTYTVIPRPAADSATPYVSIEYWVILTLSSQNDMAEQKFKTMSTMRLRDQSFGCYTFPPAHCGFPT